MEQQTRAYIWAMAAVLIWSTVASAFKLTLAYLQPIQLLLLSTMVSSVAMLVVITFQGKLKKLYKLSYDPKRMMKYALLGLLNPFIYYVVLFETYSRLPAQEAQPLNYTWPIALTILSIVFLKQKVTSRSILGILLGFVGVIVITTHGSLSLPDKGSIIGIILGLLSALIWASFWTLNLRDEQDDAIRLFTAFSFSLPIILLATVLTAGVEYSSLEGISGAIYIGLFEMGFAFLIWNRALKLSKTTASVSSLIYLVPFLSLIPIYLLVGEGIRITTIMGLVLIVSGIILGRYRT